MFKNYLNARQAINGRKLLWQVWEILNLVDW